MFNASTLSRYQINNGGPPGTSIQASTSSPSFQYFTGATVNATTGVISGTKAAFNINSIDFTCYSNCATGFTIEGLLNGTVVDTSNASVNYYLGWTTITLGWTDIDTILIPNAGVGALDMRSVNLTPYIQTIPEPMSIALVGTGLVGLGFAARRRRT